MSHNHDHRNSPGSFWRSRYALGYIIFGGVAAYFLVTEHLAHLVGILPFLLLIACPLMHIFMHHGHSHHYDGDSLKKQESEARADKETHHEPQ
jgi:hypothetical protein